MNSAWSMVDMKKKTLFLFCRIWRAFSRQILGISDFCPLVTITASFFTVVVKHALCCWIKSAESNWPFVKWGLQLSCLDSLSMFAANISIVLVCIKYISNTRCAARVRKISSTILKNIVWFEKRNSKSITNKEIYKSSPDLTLCLLMAMCR